MKSLNTYKNITTALITLISILCFSATSYADDNKKRRAGKMSTPDGFDQVLLYMGTGIFDPNNPEPFPGVTGCNGGFCDGEFFQKEIMKRTDEEIAALEQSAKDYFNTEYGLNVDELVANGRIEFKDFTFNPDIQYRLYAKSGTRVPSEGWIIRDGGFHIVITDPNGIELGGDHVGKTATTNNMMFFGNYNILVTDRYGYPKRELIINYQSSDPALITPDGSLMTFNCEIIHEKWGVGQAYGTYEFIPQDDGRIQANGRNILTFGKLSTVTEYPAFPAHDMHPYGH